MPRQGEAGLSAKMSHPNERGFDDLPSCRKPLRLHSLPPRRPQWPGAAGPVPGPVAQLRRQHADRYPARPAAHRLRPGHQSFRPGEQLRPALRQRRDQLRAPAARRLQAVPRRTDHLQQGRLGHVARPVWPGRRLAQIRARQPRPEPAAPGPGLCGYLLLAPLRPGHPTGRNRQRPGHRRAARQGAVHRYLVVFRGEDPRDRGPAAGMESATADPPAGLQPAQPLGGKGPAGHRRRAGYRRDRLYAAGPGPADRQVPQRRAEGCAGQSSGRRFVAGLAPVRSEYRPRTRLERDRPASRPEPGATGPGLDPA